MLQLPVDRICPIVLSALDRQANTMINDNVDLAFDIDRDVVSQRQSVLSPFRLRIFVIGRDGCLLKAQFTASPLALTLNFSESLRL